MNDVYEYLDYRQLLKDLYETRKAENPIFSYRYIGQKVGFTSAGYFSNVLSGKRNISDGMIFGFAELFGFDKKQTEYFELLVQYDQAPDHARRRYYFERLLVMRKAKVAELTADHYEYFDKWYHVALRELLNYYPFRGDFQTLAKRLNPPVSAPEAKKAVELLLRLGLIAEKDDHTYAVTDKTVTTGAEVPLVAINTFQIAMMELAREAIDRFPRNKRSISTLTLSLSEEVYGAIDEKLARFRREVLDMVKNDTNEIDRVYQFNFQIFPLTQERDR